jgi:cell division septation protein DedD
VDPLAALDRLEGSGGLTFQGTLAGATPVAADVEQTISAIAAKKSALAVAAPVVAPPAVAAVKKDEPKAEKPKDEKPKDKDKDKDVEAKADKPKDEKPKDKDKDKDVEAKADKPKDKEDHARYTLQLSSFQDKGEAQAFLDNLKSAGYQATLTEAEVDGKGTFYRIRYGTYRSLDAATDAKSEIEKAAHKSASIMKL